MASATVVNESDGIAEFDAETGEVRSVSGEIIEPGIPESAGIAVAEIAIPAELNSGRTLGELESVIEDSIHAQVAAGIALLEIQARKLYADTGFESFTGYLQNRWGYLSAGYRLMDAAKVQLALTGGGPSEGVALPKNEAQAREIAPLVRKNAAAAREVWQTLVSTSDPAVLTAADIRTAVREKLEELKPAQKTPTPRPEQDGPQVGAKDTDVRYRSFYGDPTVIGSHVASGAADVVVFRVGNQRNLVPRVNDLAETAASRLRKGGSMFVLTTPALLPEILEGVGDLLNYKWLIVSAMEVGKNDNDQKPTVYNGYEAVVWFTKGRYVGEIISDILDLDGEGLKGLLEDVSKEDGIIVHSALVQADMSDAVHLLNRKRRLIVTSDNKTFLPVLDTNMKDAGYLPADAADSDDDDAEDDESDPPSDEEVEDAESEVPATA